MGTSASAPPNLPIVKMSPPSGTNPPDVSVPGEENEEPRTLIVGEGSRVEARSAEEPMVSSPAKRGKDKTSTESSAKKSRAVTETGNKTP
jgi:hypothetical protein